MDNTTYEKMEGELYFRMQSHDITEREYYMLLANVSDSKKAYMIALEKENNVLNKLINLLRK